mgnify:CR=1 FL=1|jgi:hypothetical protein
MLIKSKLNLVRIQVHRFITFDKSKNNLPETQYICTEK